MHITVETDKHRFLDLEARENKELVHTVEVSDERSSHHFVTVFLKGRDPKVDGWVHLMGLRADNHHDPEIYHRDDKKTTWVMGAFPEFGTRWTHHYHVRLKKPPTFEDVKKLETGIPKEIMSEIRDYFSTKPQKKGLLEKWRTQ